MIQLILLVIAVLGLAIPEKLFSKKQLENMTEEKFKKSVKNTRLISVLIIVLVGLQFLIGLL